MVVTFLVGERVTMARPWVGDVCWFWMIMWKDEGSTYCASDHGGLTAGSVVIEKEHYPFVRAAAAGGYHVCASERVGRVNLAPGGVRSQHVRWVLAISRALRVEYIARICGANGTAVGCHVKGARVGERVAEGEDCGVLDPAGVSEVAHDGEVGGDVAKKFGGGYADGGGGWCCTFGVSVGKGICQGGEECR